MNRTLTALPGLGNRIVRFWDHHKWSYFFIAPSMLLFFIFIAYPVTQAFVLAFQKVDLRGGTWIGLKNFEDLGTSKLFWSTMQHTFIYAVFVVVAWITSSMIVASLTHSETVFWSPLRPSKM